MPSLSVAAVSKQRPPFLDPRGFEEGSLVGGHRVARPGAEPWIAGDDGRAEDHELIGGEQELRVDLVRGAGDECVRACSRGTDDVAGRRVA
jgi:hypothetical protein